MIDVVLPKDNENRFVELAKKLGLGGLVFVYSKRDVKLLEKVKALADKDFKVMTGLLVEKNAQLKHAKHFDLVFAPAERSFVENRHVDVVMPAEEDAKKDSAHQRKSGLNEVLCKAGKEKIFAVSFGKLMYSKEKELILGRQVQNVKLLKKFRNKIMIASFAKKPYHLKAPKDLMAYGEILGLHPTKAKATVNLLD